MFYSNRHFKNVKNIIKLQLFMGLLCSIFTIVITKDINSSFSAFLGFILAILPTLIYIRIAFAKGLIAAPQVVLARHYKAMILKFILNIILFMLLGY